MPDVNITSHARAFSIETDDPKVKAIVVNMSRICAVNAAFDIRNHIADLYKNKEAMLSGALGVTIPPEVFQHLVDSTAGWAMCVQQELQDKGLVDEEGKPIMVMEEHLVIEDFAPEEKLGAEPDSPKTH